VTDDYVAFNTESCTLYVVDARSGRVAWEKWLGDPLMAQPAISGSTLFMAYPDNRGKHWLSAFDLQNGEGRWKTALMADVISAPVVDGGSVYAATLDGTVYRIDAETGKSLWSIHQRATSAPWLHRGKIYISLREEVKGTSETFTAEAFQTAIIDNGFDSQIKSFSRRKAEYLKMGHQSESFYATQDAQVGFASAPGAAKIHMAREHLGLGHVASVWSFQGSRPEVFDDGCFGVLDDIVQKVELGTKRPLWRSRLVSDENEKQGNRRLGRNLSPPAVSTTRLYLTSVLGDVFALDRQTGEEIWALNVGSPILSQPSLAEGKVFLGTADGFLYAFESSDPDPVGWPMWGGGPGHNGPGHNGPGLNGPGHNGPGLNGPGHNGPGLNGPA
jgi:Ca-activated chloride channel family protein